jgi:hypothetical protein
VSPYRTSLSRESRAAGGVPTRLVANDHGTQSKSPDLHFFTELLTSAGRQAYKEWHSREAGIVRPEVFAVAKKKSTKRPPSLKKTVAGVQKAVKDLNLHLNAFADIVAGTGPPSFRGGTGKGGDPET